MPAIRHFKNQKAGRGCQDLLHSEREEKMEIVETSVTGWHWLGPWTGYILGVTLSAALIVLNRKL